MAAAAAMAVAVAAGTLLLLSALPAAVHNRGPVARPQKRRGIARPFPRGVAGLRTPTLLEFQQQQWQRQQQ